MQALAFNKIGEPSEVGQLHNMPDPVPGLETFLSSVHLKG
jgi:hypothetical protein